VGVRIAITSDTHLPRFGRELPRALVEGFERERIERILHAGDWTTTLAVDLLERIAPVEGVAGNNDGPELHGRFGTRKVLELDGVRIGITHGHLGQGRSTEERAIRAFEDADLRPDVVVFGHSHIPEVRRLASGRWLINPGSPTDKRRQPAYTWALLELNARTVIRAELFAFASHIR
jgi:putative phosphoesterase